MTKISDIMSRNVAYLRQSDTVQAAAQLMANRNIGALPICDGQRLIGVITDRDIAVRCAAQNLPAAEFRAMDAMTGHLQWCFSDESVEDAKKKMEAAQIRRLPIVDRDYQLVGMLSLGDLAIREGDAQHTLAEISKPPASPMH